MPATAVEVLHDDGRWYVATLMGQHRDRTTGAWRCGVRYYTAPGATYQRVVWAEECRAVDDDRRDQAPIRHDGADRPASHVTPTGTATRPEPRVW